MRMWSNFASLLLSLLSILIRSPLTVQQMQPLFISKTCEANLVLAASSDVVKESIVASILTLTSSSVSSTRASSTPTSPNSFSITAIFSPCFSLRMWFTSAEKDEAMRGGKRGEG